MGVRRVAVLATVVAMQVSLGLGLADAWGATPRVVVKVTTPSVVRGGTLHVTLGPGVDHCTLSVAHLTPRAKTKVVVARARKASLTVPVTTTLGNHVAVVRCRQGLSRSTFKVVAKVAAGGAAAGFAPSPSPSASPSASPSVSPTASPSASTTASPSASASASATASPSASPTPSPSASLTASPSASPTPSPTLTPSPSPSPTETWAEEVGGDTRTFTDYTDAGGDEGAIIPTNTTVQITCRLKGFVVPDGNDWWYLIASSPWSNEYYASADAFYNAPNITNLADGPFVDMAVALCPTTSP